MQREKLRRLYRKLSLRNRKRSVGEEPFNVDRLVAKQAGQEWSCPISRKKVVCVSNPSTGFAYEIRLFSGISNQFIAKDGMNSRLKPVLNGFTTDF